MRLTHAIHQLQLLELQPQHICDEKVPSCERCAAEGLMCQYDAGAVNTHGVDAEQDLRYRLEAKEREYQESMFLLRIFRHGSEEDAQALLARLRIGHDVGEIIGSLRGTAGQSASK